MDLSNTNTNIWPKPLASLYALPWSLLVVVLLMTSSSCSVLVNGEFYSSVDSWKQLGGIESTLLQGFRTYLKEQQDDLAALRRFMEHIRFQHTLATEDMEGYLGNPINAFNLIKRVVRDWNGVNDFLRFEKPQYELSELLTQLNQSSSLPDENELKRAVLSLVTLQDIYNLSPEDMANGKRYGSVLGWDDCFEIGATLADEKQFVMAISWLKLAKAKLANAEEESDIKEIMLNQIEENLAYISLAMGDKKEALKYLSKTVGDKPENSIQLTIKYLN